MRDIGSKVFLPSLVILDLRDVIHDDKIKDFAREESVRLITGLSDDLYLIDLSADEIIDADNVYAVLAAQDVIGLQLVAVIEISKESVERLRKTALKEILELEYSLIAEYRTGLVIDGNANAYVIQHCLLDLLFTLKPVDAGSYLSAQGSISDKISDKTARHENDKRTDKDEKPVLAQNGNEI